MRSYPYKGEENYISLAVPWVQIDRHTSCFFEVTYYYKNLSMLLYGRKWTLNCYTEDNFSSLAVYYTGPQSLTYSLASQL